VDRKGSRISVNIQASAGVLNVNIENNFDPQRVKEVGGIGLQNLHRRVQHYYGSKAAYSATAANDVYLFRLSCPLS
jgi:sensor histidine kinase YesM